MMTTAHPLTGNQKGVTAWLLTGCLLIMAMVVIGGVTRLTHSGLSMVKWNLFGTTPPLTTEKWNVLFDQYKQSPEFLLVNAHFGLNDFKRIFWWEFIHRFLGRTIGLAFILPFAWFAWKKQLSSRATKRLLLILGLGMAQGIFGWIMVKSGLNRVPHVSHYLLALHLGTAFITFALTFWLWMDVRRFSYGEIVVERKTRILAISLIALTSVQIIYGAFVAGLKAGVYYPEFPMMGASIIPWEVAMQQPLITKLFANGVVVQFIHRVLGMLIVVNVLALLYSVRNQVLSTPMKRALYLTSGIALLQVTLGISTLLLGVAVWIASLHQLTAFVLFGAVLYLAYVTRNNVTASAQPETLMQDQLRTKRE
jgi:heme a synthase